MQGYQTQKNIFLSKAQPDYSKLFHMWNFPLIFVVVLEGGQLIDDIDEIWNPLI